MAAVLILLSRSLDLREADDLQLINGALRMKAEDLCLAVSVNSTAAK